MSSGPLTLNDVRSFLDKKISSIKKDLYFPSEEDVKLNYDNVLKYRIENHGVKGIVCPTCSHTDTYTYDSPHHGLLLMCNVCEDGYEISFEEVKDE